VWPLVLATAIAETEPAPGKNALAGKSSSEREVVALEKETFLVAHAHCFCNRQRIRFLSQQIKSGALLTVCLLACLDEPEMERRAAPSILPNISSSFLTA
jgi:hypothetical protein